MTPRGDHPGHGTDAGYQWEWRHGREVCDECRDAHNVAGAAWKAARKQNARSIATTERKDHVTRLQGKRVTVPIGVFRDLYLAVDPATALRMDDIVGWEKIDSIIKRADQLDADRTHPQ